MQRILRPLYFQGVSRRTQCARIPLENVQHRLLFRLTSSDVRPGQAHPPNNKETLTNSTRLLQSAQELLKTQRRLQAVDRNSQTNVNDSKTMIQTQFQIRQLIMNLANQFWIRNQTSDLNTAVPAAVNRLQDATNTTQEQVVQAVQTADQLAHLLMDYKLQMISPTPDRHHPHSPPHPNSTIRYFSVFNNVLHGWMHISHLDELYAPHAQSLLLRMMELNSKRPQDRDVQVDTISFSLCIQTFALSRLSTVEPALQALQLLVQMEQLHHQKGQIFHRVIPNTRVYNNCLHGFAKRGMMDEAETLLAIMEHNYTRHFKIPTSLTTTTSTALDFNTTTSPTPTQDTSSSLSSIHYTHFQYLQQLKTSMIFPDTVSYTTCLDACAKAKKTLPSRLDSRLVIIPKETRAQRILSRMLELYESTQDIRFQPTHATFGTIIGLYAKWNDATAPILAHGFLQTLIQLSEREKTSLPVSKTKKFYSLQPNAFMFSTVMSTYNRQKIKDADERVAKLLGQMEQLYEAGNELCKPTFQCFVMCLDAYAKSKKDDSAEKAEAILTRLEQLYLNKNMKDLNRVAYNTVIEAWGRKYDNKEAVHRAQGILLRMKAMYDQTRNPGFLPDKYTYSGIMTAWLYRNDDLADEKCMRLLQEMKEEYHRGNHLLKPDSFVYAQVINAFANAGKPFEALSILTEMENSVKNGDGEHIPTPTIHCYNGVMKAFAKSDIPDRAKHALNLLQDMKSKVNIYNVPPNTITYSTCIYAFSRSNEMDRVEIAESLFQELVNAYQESKNEDMKPSKDSWSLLILTHVYSETKDRTEKALSVIDRIVDCGMVPMNSHYNIVLLACGLDAKKIGNQPTNIEHVLLRSLLCRVVYKIMSAFDQRVYGIKPDSTTFMNLLNCSSLFLDMDERNTFIKNTVDRCKEAGLVDDQFIELLRKRAPRTLSNELLPGFDEKKNFAIPPAWSKGVKTSKFMRRDERKSPKYENDTWKNPIFDSNF